MFKWVLIEPNLANSAQLSGVPFNFFKTILFELQKSPCPIHTACKNIPLIFRFWTFIARIGAECDISIPVLGKIQVISSRISIGKVYFGMLYQYDIGVMFIAADSDIKILHIPVKRPWIGVGHTRDYHGVSGSGRNDYHFLVEDGRNGSPQIWKKDTREWRMPEFSSYDPTTYRWAVFFLRFCWPKLPASVCGASDSGTISEHQSWWRLLPGALQLEACGIYHLPKNNYFRS